MQNIREDIKKLTIVDEDIRKQWHTSKMFNAVIMDIINSDTDEIALGKMIKYLCSYDIMHNTIMKAINTLCDDGTHSKIIAIIQDLLNEAEEKSNNHQVETL